MNFARNNFDLIRLFAALQVALAHIGEHLTAPTALAAVNQALSYFPGVPVFFFISGLLISRSFEKGRNLGDFARNRALRIFPALWVCLGLSLAMVTIAGYWRTSPARTSEFAGWLAAQLSFFQFYNPEFLRGYGVGVLNGSLWTVSVELQFYCLVPLLYWLLGCLREPHRDKVLILLTVIFLGVNQIYVYFANTGAASLIFKLVGVSFIPWLYMFLVGVYCQRKIQVIWELLIGRWWVVLLLVPAIVLGQRWSLSAGGNYIGPAIFLLLCASVLICAYTAPELGERVLRKNDISYGCYIFHMPLVNFFRQAGLATTSGAWAALFITIVLSGISWRYVEQPALRLKRNPMRIVTPDNRTA